MIIDCAVHPVLTSTRFNEYVGGPWNLRQLPTLFGDRSVPHGREADGREGRARPDADEGAVGQGRGGGVVATGRCRGKNPKNPRLPAIALTGIAEGFQSPADHDGPDTLIYAALALSMNGAACAISASPTNLTATWPRHSKRRIFPLQAA